MTRRFRQLIAVFALSLGAQAAPPVPNSYAPVDDRESFETIKARLEKEKGPVNARFQRLLTERYDLSDKPLPGVTSSARSKPIQGGVRVKLKGVNNWLELASLSPEEIKRRDLWPAGFLPLPPDRGRALPGSSRLRRGPAGRRMPRGRRKSRGDAGRSPAARRAGC